MNSLNSNSLNGRIIGQKDIPDQTRANISHLREREKVEKQTINEPIKINSSGVSSSTPDKILKGLSKGLDIISSIKLPNIVLFKLCKDAFSLIFKSGKKNNDLNSEKLEGERVGNSVDNLTSSKKEFAQKLVERDKLGNAWKECINKGNIFPNKSKDKFSELCKECNILKNQIDLLNLNEEEAKAIAKSHEPYEIPNSKFEALFKDIQNLAGKDNPTYAKLGVLLDSSSKASIKELKSELSKLIDDPKLMEKFHEADLKVSSIVQQQIPKEFNEIFLNNGEGFNAYEISEAIKWVKSQK